MTKKAMMGWLVCAVLAGPGVAETVKDREGSVRGDKAKLENDARWIYNDVDRGFAEAKKSGKPLLVTLRCIPCKACMGLDAVILAKPELAPLLDQFVCVRIINANTLDLDKFQFDYDLSFSTMFFHSDGTIYGRYGSWTHQEDDANADTEGYKTALKYALAIHRGYPANKALLAGKQGGPAPFKTPVEIPKLAEKYPRELDWGGKVVPSCVHCHQIGDAFRTSYREQGKPIPSELIYPMPAPETIGLTLAPDQAAHIASVAAGTIAARSGFAPGDDIVSLGGQPLISIADVAWVLHRAPDGGPVAAIVQRGGATKTLTLALEPGWRKKSDISRRVGTWPMRGMATGGLVLEDLSDDARQQRGLAKDALALNIKRVGQYGQHAAGKNAGFRQDDIVVEIDGVKTRMTEGELIGRLLQTHKPGEKIPATVLRGQQQVSLKLPMQ